MDERMMQAAESGDINDLHQLIGEDVNLLDRIDQVHCVQTPLHIAASAGHIQFAMEMMGLKPLFARKLNLDGFSPIHLALKNGHIELVHQFLEIDRDLAHVKGNECITPLHYVVATGDHHIDLLDKFLLVCSDSIRDVTVRDETALHIALKNDQLVAFKFLVGWLGRNFFKNASLNVKTVLDQKDDEGNTVLHITISKNETQIVSHLLAWGFQFVDVNSTNLEGKTAWDILQGQTQVNSKEIRLMLHSAGALSGVSLFSNTQSDDNNIDEFYNLIGEDVQLLEHIDELPFVNTPLHIAASYGNIQFALEMMSLKPSFARKQNQNGLSPIHLALRNKYTKLVVCLLQIDGDLVRVKGRERLTPLHYIVESGLRLLNSSWDGLETILFENAEYNERKVLSWQDNEGNTVLHILVSKNQTQAVRHFLSWGKRFVDVNSKNLEDKTAWDILQEDNREIRDMLRRAGAKPGSSLSTSNRYPNPKYQRLSKVDGTFKLRRAIRKFTVERRSMLLVVAVLLATLTYQAVLNPPGGVWQDNGLCITTEPPFNKTVGSSNYPKIIYLSQSNTTLACEHKAGTAIALEDPIFNLFLMCNIMLFSLSNLLIVLLILNLCVKVLFRTLSFILLLSFFYSVWTITDDPGLMIPLVSVAALFYVFILLL